jgi:hypothetical protein
MMHALSGFAVHHKKTFQKVAVAFFLLFLVAVLDSICFTVFESKTVFKVIHGGQTPISGKLEKPVDAKRIPKQRPGGEFDPDGIEKLNRLLAYEPLRRDYRIRFTGLHGRTWQGVLITEPSAVPGEFGFEVFARDNPPVSSETPAYRVIVYAESTAYRQSFFSLSKRWLGINPWWISLIFLPVSILFFVAVFHATKIEDDQLQADGIGPIYKLAKRKDHWEVIFGIGRRQGVLPGDTLLILDASRNPVGELSAAQVQPDHATARVALEKNIRADYLIARPAHPVKDGGSDETRR